MLSLNKKLSELDDYPFNFKYPLNKNNKKK